MTEADKERARPRLDAGSRLVAPSAVAGDGATRRQPDIADTDRPNRLFVAVVPPERVLQLLAELPRPEERGVRWVPPEQWHVTLRFLGDAEPAAVSDALEHVELPAATAHLGPTIGRLGHDALVLPASGLDELAAAVTRATGRLGRPDDGRRFFGHLTLARLRARAACGLADRRCIAAWEVQEVALVASTLTPSGAVHHVVSRHRTGPGTDPVAEGTPP